MFDITLTDLISIHSEIQRRFHVSRGIINRGLLDSIVQRPNLSPYSFLPYPNIYSKCASLLEGIIKWHPFADGNKRTGLAAASTYMFKNGYRLVLPLSSVRFSVLIAEDKRDLSQIARWVKKHTAKSSKAYNNKLKRFIELPQRKLHELYNTGQKTKAEKILEKWFAYDRFPAYQDQKKEIIKYFESIADGKLTS